MKQYWIIEVRYRRNVTRGYDGDYTTHVGDWKQATAKAYCDGRPNFEEARSIALNYLGLIHYENDVEVLQVYQS